MRRIVLLLLVAPALCGCVVANKTLRADYSTYNETIQYTQSEQMLLNLVRMKYRESPLFLKVGALSASYSFEANAGADFGKITGIKSYGIDIGSSFATKPTITYTPLEGSTFVRQVLGEVEPETFILLFRSGWPVSELCRVIVERIGTNLNKLSDPTYERFAKVVDVLQEGQDTQNLGFFMQDDTLMVRLKTYRKDLYSSERLETEQEYLVPFSTFQLRSFLDILFFLGKNTEVPEAHRDRVKQHTPNELMRIRSSRGVPTNALVWVEHQGYYFSIDNNDIQSKDTFALLKLLFQMQAGDTQAMQPVLTLPVALP